MNTLENANSSYHFYEGLKLISKCPLCAEQYQPFQASIVEEKDDAQLVHIQCRRCQSSIVALLVNGQLGLTSVGLITDLTSSDVETFKDAKPIAEEQVFTTFEALTNDSGAFARKLLSS